LKTIRIYSSTDKHSKISGHKGYLCFLLPDRYFISHQRMSNKFLTGIHLL
jgi:hypothetical protein